MKVSAESFVSAQQCLVVGVGQYDDRKLQSLPSPADNAKDVAAALTSRRGCGLRSSQVRCLVDEAATREAILSELGLAVASRTAADSLIVYFAGHGVRRG